MQAEATSVASKVGTYGETFDVAKDMQSRLDGLDMQMRALAEKLQTVAKDLRKAKHSDKLEQRVEKLEAEKEHHERHSMLVRIDALEKEIKTLAQEMRDYSSSSENEWGNEEGGS